MIEKERMNEHKGKDDRYFALLSKSINVSVTPFLLSCVLALGVDKIIRTAHSLLHSNFATLVIVKVVVSFIVHPPC